MRAAVKTKGTTRPYAAKGGANAIDTFVGKRIRERRRLLGMSQQSLAEALGVTFQQVQKYENGANRVGASRLWHMGQILRVELDYFFKELPDEAAATAGTREQLAVTEGPMERRETVSLVRAYYQIPNPSIRRRFYELLRSLGEA